MSVTQYQCQINSLDKEILSLEKKKSERDKKYANLQKKICEIQKSITKYTSPTSYANKLRQISNWQIEAVQKYTDSADLEKKIAVKKAKRNEYLFRLHKAHQDEQKKQYKESQKLQNIYKCRNTELHRQKLQYVEPEQMECMLEKEYDVFISHAYEDKEEFVDELVEALKVEGFVVWYDSFELKWGDKMREKIDEGLKRSKFGIVVLSPNYIKEGKYWTKMELNALFQKESICERNILPIWHNLTKEQVFEYSPMIADAMAMTTIDMTANEIAVKLKTIFGKSETKEKTNG